MAAKFERPIGAAADVSELEYISALHQTDMSGLRQNGSIKDEDIKVFLSSRYGIKVSKDQVREEIIHGLGGGTEEDDVIDLMEIVAILLIPTLLKAKIEETTPGKYIEEKNLVAPEPGLLRRVLAMVLEDATGDSDPAVLDVALLKRIFETYGETDLANNDQLLNEMIQAIPKSRRDAEDGTILLNVETFAEALTKDVELFEIENETRKTTNFDDVFLTEHHVSERGGGKRDVEEIETKLSLSTEIQLKPTAPSVDSTAGTFRSKHLFIALWATVIITYFAYFFQTGDMSVAGSEVCPAFEYNRIAPWASNNRSIACQSGYSILVWLFSFFVFSAFGLFMIGFGSIGNSSECKRPYVPLLGMVFVFLMVVLPYLFSEHVRGRGYLNNASLGLGLVVCYFHFSNFCVMTKIRDIRGGSFLFSPSLLVRESILKKSRERKIVNMTRNALDVLGRTERGVAAVGSNFGRGLHNFAVQGFVVEKIGGFRWTWKNILNRNFLEEYGLSFSSRLISSNIAQFIVSLYVIIAGINLINFADQNFDKDETKELLNDLAGNFIDSSVNDQLVSALISNFTNVVGGFVGSQLVASQCPNNVDYSPDFLDRFCTFDADGVYQCDPNAGVDFRCAIAQFAANSSQGSGLDSSRKLGLLEAAGFDVDSLQTLLRNSFEEASTASVESLYPSSKNMVMVPLICGTIVAFITAVYLAVIFLPSVVATILQLRSGVIPTLRNQDFNKYRAAIDQVTLVSGSLFWGCFIASSVVGGFLALVIFLSMWQTTAFLAQRALAVVLGIIAVALVRLLILTFGRVSWYRSFYRKDPRKANIAFLGLEWANFSLSVGFVLIRMLRIVVTALVFIGRIDKPFLAVGVGKIGVLELDNYPTIFKKDLLSFEAHRHPYIEMLGTAYLMKLRYRNFFGRRAGSAWRLIFVYALMPWMHKYRIHVASKLEELLHLNSSPALNGDSSTPNRRVQFGANGISPSLASISVRLPATPEATCATKSPYAKSREQNETIPRIVSPEKPTSDRYGEADSGLRVRGQDLTRGHVQQLSQRNRAEREYSSELM